MTLVSLRARMNSDRTSAMIERLSTPDQMLFKRLTQSARWPPRPGAVILMVALWVISSVLCAPYVSAARQHQLSCRLDFVCPYALTGDPFLLYAVTSFTLVTSAGEILLALITAALAGLWAGREAGKHEEYQLLYLAGLTPETIVQTWFDVVLFRMRLAYSVVMGLFPAMLLALYVGRAAGPDFDYFPAEWLFSFDMSWSTLWLLTVIRLAASVGVWQGVLWRSPGPAALLAPLAVLVVTGF